MSKYSLLFAILFLGAAATPVYSADSKSAVGSEKSESAKATNEKKYNKNNALVKAASAGDTKKVLELIKNGANVNAKMDDGLTALMFAAYKGYEDIAELLISNGAKVNIQGKYCKTALDYAKDEKMIKYLKSEGAKKGSQIKGCKVNTTKKQTVKHQF